MKYFFSFVLFTIVSMNSYAARMDCPIAKVLHIQIEGKKILYRQAGGTPWRTLGYLGNNDGTEERYTRSTNG